MFACVVSVSLFMYIHLSGYISFVLRLHQNLSYLQPNKTKLSATAGPPVPSQKLYFGRDIWVKGF